LTESVFKFCGVYLHINLLVKDTPIIVILAKLVKYKIFTQHPGQQGLAFPLRYKASLLPRPLAEKNIIENPYRSCYCNTKTIDGGFDMQSVTVSPKYQVVIPKTVRESMNLRPGQKMQVVEYAGRIELIPERDIQELRGFLKGINTEFKREKDRI
jgi:AbrB family looped-hinge helix DNA binding protein